MHGIIVFKYRFNKNTTLFTLKLSNGDTVKTFVVDSYRNSVVWNSLNIGDSIQGLRWKDVKKRIVDADSPVVRF